MTDIQMLKKIIKKNIINLLTQKLTKRIKDFGYAKREILEIETWEWEMIVEKINRNSIEFKNILKIMELKEEFLTTKEKMIKDSRAKARRKQTA